MSSNDWHNFSADDYEKLADAYGTPFYLYDADMIAHRVESVRRAFAGLAEIYYAVKANPNLELLRSIRQCVNGLDISSTGELQQALLAGYQAERLSFAGPGKTRHELADAVTEGVGCISVESVRELKDVISVSRKLGLVANVGLRVNPNQMVRSFGLKMGGKATQFGIEEDSLAELVLMVQEHRNSIRFTGIHIYAGSQCFEPEAIATGVNDTIRIVKEVERETGVQFMTVNFGGGFGVSHGDQEHELDIEETGKLVAPLLSAFKDESPEPRRLVFELGRYLTASAGIYVARVISEKTSRGKQFFVSDGGLHHHLSAAGTFGTALRGNYEIRNLTAGKAPVVSCNIAGPSCNPTDLLGVNLELPQPHVGDLLAVMKSGSYGLTASPLLFLGRQTPAEVVYREGELVLGRRPMTMTEFN